MSKKTKSQPKDIKTINELKREAEKNLGAVTLKRLAWIHGGVQRMGLKERIW